MLEIRTQWCKRYSFIQLCRMFTCSGPCAAALVDREILGRSVAALEASVEALGRSPTALNESEALGCSAAALEGSEVLGRSAAALKGSEGAASRGRESAWGRLDG